MLYPCECLNRGIVGCEYICCCGWWDCHVAAGSWWRLVLRCQAAVAGGRVNFVWSQLRHVFLGRHCLLKGASLEWLLLLLLLLILLLSCCGLSYSELHCYLARLNVRRRNKQTSSERALHELPSPEKLDTNEIQQQNVWHSFFISNLAINRVKFGIDRH